MGKARRLAGTAATEVRDEAPGDAPAIREVVKAAFGHAAEADLIDRLWSDGDCMLSLVAVEAGRLVGHVLLSRMTAPLPALALAPLSVAPDRQRTGIGSQLVGAALDRAAANGWKAVFVLGEPAYYRRFGFDAALARGFRSPYAGPFLMMHRLGDGASVDTGRIEHAPAFRNLR